MIIIPHTNIDNYKSTDFPLLVHVPRKGECVMVTKSSQRKFLDKRLPIKLEVVDVTYTDDTVDVELWYRKTDVEMAKLNNINLF